MITRDPHFRIPPGHEIAPKHKKFRRCPDRKFLFSLSNREWTFNRPVVVFRCPDPCFPAPAGKSLFPRGEKQIPLATSSEGNWPGRRRTRRCSLPGRWYLPSPCPPPNSRGDSRGTWTVSSRLRA